MEDLPINGGPLKEFHKFYWVWNLLIKVTSNWSCIFLENCIFKSFLSVLFVCGEIRKTRLCDDCVKWLIQFLIHCNLWKSRSYETELELINHSRLAKIIMDPNSDWRPLWARFCSIPWGWGGVWQLWLFCCSLRRRRKRNLLKH